MTPNETLSPALPAGLRGDYSRMASDYVVAQDHATYLESDHDRWRRLYARQRSRLPGRASGAFVRALDSLGAHGGIPRLDEASDFLYRATGWTLAGVPGLIPGDAFFGHLAERRFPVTVWLRQEHELDYVVEPDIFHDFFGHVPLLSDPAFADFLQDCGRQGLLAARSDALDFFGRLYWFTVEFWLIRDPEGVRAYGAGILSSPAELAHSLGDAPVRHPFDPERIMRTAYRIDSLQPEYFVLGSFRELADLLGSDLSAIYARLRRDDPN